MQALKTSDKEGRKFYEDNGSLAPHFSGEDERDDTSFSLYEVVRHDRPLVIADEGHNAKTVLALDLIESLEPSFVLELTATPLEKSNILSRVSALDLKGEQMVKLPVNLHNLHTWQDTIEEAVRKRAELEDATLEREETGEYLRPILLLQAAEVKKPTEGKIDVAQIKDYLTTDLKVPEGEIKIKTGKQDDLGSTDLMAEGVEVRYVITRSALQEGWDAPFAYVLASVYRLSSPTAVEQLLRLPNVREKKRPELNEAYVYTSAEEFGKVLGSIIKGMESNGYGRDEVRIADGAKKEPYIVTMQARHTGLTVPLLAVDDGEADERRELKYVEDLLGPDFGLDGLGFDPVSLNDPLTESGRVGLADDATFKKEILDPYLSSGNGSGAGGTGGSRADLVGWLLEKIGKYNEIADTELLGYVELAVDELLETNPLDLLHRARYHVRDQIQAHLADHYLSWAKARYEEIKPGTGTKKLVADPNVAFAVLTELRLPAAQCNTSYRKSVFEYPGKLNNQEAELATDLDGLDNVLCWYRNADKGEFALQGYRRPKFNPDFIAFTKSGKTAVLEWKGAGRTSNEDTRHKEALGNDWAPSTPTTATSR